MDTHCSIVIPFYNEEACVANVIEEVHLSLKHAGISFEIIAVENGSKDRTGEILKALENRFKELRVIYVPINLGFGYGVIKGLSASMGEIVGYMPGDGQIDPDVVPQILEKMKQRQADIGMGRRITREDGWIRWFVSRCYNLLGRFLFSLSTKDINGHPKLLTRRAYSIMQLQSHDGFLDPEIILKAQRLHIKVCEVNVGFRRRKTGRSSVKWTTCVEFMLNLIRARFMKKDPWGLNSLK